VLEVEERIGRGELVGTMCDRVGFDAREARVPFLGGEAAFPTGPYLLAHALRCPVYACFALFRAPNRYEICCEPFADAIVLPRGPAREAAARALAARFAGRLEHYCRLYPDNWFNFYDFWGAREPGDPRTGAA
jgi:predicted LPLAT superfamily acyltransferase